MPFLQTLLYEDYLEQKKDLTKLLQVNIGEHFLMKYTIIKLLLNYYYHYPCLHLFAGEVV